MLWRGGAPRLTTKRPPHMDGDCFVTLGSRRVSQSPALLDQRLPAMTFVFVFLLASCAPRPISPLPNASPQPIPTFTETSIPVIVPEPTSTFLPPTLMPTPVPCDPFTVEYCVTDGHFIFQRPIQPPHNDSLDVTYRYASTANGAREPHHGVEIGKDFGTPVQSAADGVVLFAGADDAAMFSPWRVFYGNMIVIQHDGDLFTLYAHLSAIAVEQGQAVTAGEKIGEVGQSGAATGSHLHFEVRAEDIYDYFATLNPELWLAPGASCGALMISVVDADGTFRRAKLTIQQYSGTKEVLTTYYLDTYDPTLAVGVENAAMSDLTAGRYRIAFVYNGHLYERWVEVQSGKLTQVAFVVK